jgi:hypothetical protein
MFLATESLVLQLMRSCGPHRAPVLRVVRSRHPGVVGHAMVSAAFSIIDATEDPREALAILEEGIDRGRRARIAVYTEIIHEGLEIPVRSLGAALWLGPCSESDWESILDGIEAGALVSPVASRSSDIASPIDPAGLRRQSRIWKGDLR